MKKTIKLIIALFVFLTLYSNSFATPPAYRLTAQNFTYLAPNELTFDIYILCTNTADTVFQFALGQYYFNFDSTYFAGGTIFYGFAPSAIGDSSDFPFINRPRNPTRVLNQLRVNSNASAGIGNGPIVSGVAPGSKVIRMVLRTSAAAFFSNDPHDLKIVWRNANAGNPFTKIFGYVGGISREMTDSTKHFIEIITGIGNPVSGITALPKEFNLAQNYPNPFNPTTKIEFALPVSGNVNLLIYDVSGREIKNLVNEFKNAGTYSVLFNGADFASGMYFYRITVKGEKTYDVTKKMILIK